MAQRRKEEKTVAKSIDDIPPRQRACRVHHPWPSEQLVDYRRPPAGLWFELADAATDMWHLCDQCPRCGCVRYQKCPSRMLVGNPWLRRYDKDWVVCEERITPRDAFAVTFTRNVAKIPTGGT